MRIGINGLFWPQEFTGSGQYTRNLWKALLSLEDGESRPDYYLLGYGERFPDLPSDYWLGFEQPSFLERAGDKALKIWWEQAGLPVLANRQSMRGNTLDLVHYPYFAAPLVKPRSKTAVVVTIHDLIPLIIPEYLASLSARLYFRLVSQAARRADLILADSECSKRDILRLLKVPPSKVAVAYLGVDGRYRDTPVPAEQKTALLQKYRLKGNERLLFYMGGYDVRKNVKQLVKAFGRALPRLKELESRDGGGPWTLVLAGRPHTSNAALYPDLTVPIREAVGEGEDATRIHFTGFIDEDDKPLLYRVADIFAFPSRYEGFGLDPLEALASGTPAICSNASSLPEVVGNAARLVSPDDLNGWEEAIVEMAAKPDLRRALSLSGPGQARKFTWEGCARRTLELYRMMECVQTRGKS